MDIEVLLYDKKLISSNCEYVVFISNEGETGILKNHEPIILYSSEGYLKIVFNNKMIRYIYYINGVFKFNENKAILLAHFGIMGEDKNNLKSELDNIIKTNKQINLQETIDYQKLERDLIENIKKGSPSNL